MNRNVGLGLGFIAVAIFMILSIFGLIPDINITRAIITFILIVIMITSLSNLEFFGFFIPASILVIIYRQYLPIEEVGNMYILLIGVFFALGFGLIVKKKPITKQNNAESFHDYQSKDNHQNKRNNDDEEEVYFESRFASISRFVKSKNLKVLTINNSFGNLSVYLEDAIISQDGLIVNINNSFGDVKIYLRDENKVIDNIEVTLGNVVIKPFHKDGVYENTASFNGNVSFGKVEIILI